MKTRDPLFILYVHDMERAVAFYRAAFELPVVQQTPGWSMLRCAGATIALHQIYPGGKESVCAHAGINLQVDDLGMGIRDVLSAGGEHIVTREPNEFVPVRMCELRDSEGNGIELRQFVGPPPDLAAVEA